MQSHECLNICVETLGEWVEGKEGLTELREKPLFCQMFLSVGSEGGGSGLSKYRASQCYIYESPEAQYKQGREDNVHNVLKTSVSLIKKIKLFNASTIN